MNRENKNIFILHGKFLPQELIRILDKAGYHPLLLDADKTAFDPHFINQVAVIIIDASIDQPKLLASFESAVLLGTKGLETRVDLFLDRDYPLKDSLQTIQFAVEKFKLARQNYYIQNSLQIEQQRLKQLTQIGIALSQEKNLGKLLHKILDEAQTLSHCDAVSLFLIDREEEDNPQLVFKLAKNNSIPIDFEEKRFALNNHSIAGYCALNKQVVNIKNAYTITDEPYTFDSSFDKAMGYRTISILAIPITNNQDEVIGVLQYINRKQYFDTILDSDEKAIQHVIEFDKSIEGILTALAGQAAIAIENSVLVDNINNLLDGFVHASVTAIEQRDPTTSGHSFRVADLTCGLAESLQRTNIPTYAHIAYSQRQMREIRFAALLHDFGKVGVRERVLVKPKKLDNARLEVLQYRFELEKERLRRKAQDAILQLYHTGQYQPQAIEKIKQQLAQQLDRLDRYLATIVSANEPTVLPDGDFEHLKEILHLTFINPKGIQESIISEQDFLALSVRKGSLTTEERLEIQSHVVHTYNFLTQIPWTTDLDQVATIAGAHHEKLDGSGYPNGLREDEIPFPSKMMTICDIFDALVAKDRPYKRALPLQVALKIINDEADQGFLDKALVDIFMQARVYDITQRKDYKIDWEKDKLMQRRTLCDVNLK